MAGLSRIHVEVIIDHMRSRFGAEVALQAVACGTMRGSAKAHGRHKKQTGGRGQFGDCHIEIEPLTEGDFEFVNAIKGGVIPHGFIPAVEKGVLEAMQAGAVAATPSRACACGCSTAPTTPSTRRRWRSSWPARSRSTRRLAIRVIYIYSLRLVATEAGVSFVM